MQLFWINRIKCFRGYIYKKEDKYYSNDHELIYDHYVTPMIKFLKDFDSLSGKSEDDNYYRALALSGLQNITGFTKEERNSIINAENYFRKRGLNCKWYEN